MSNDIVLKLVLKYLKENHYCQAMLALQQQSENNYHNYPKQIQFFRKIILKGDFPEVVKFLLTFQTKIQQRQLKKLILDVYKQKLYQLIQEPNQAELKNLFEKQIINYCSEEQYQTFFTYLTCRNVQDIPGLINWTPINGRTNCFESALPTLQKLIPYNYKKQETELNLQTIVYDYLGRIDQSKPNKKGRHGKQSLQNINYKQSSQTYHIKERKEELQSSRNQAINSKVNRFKNTSSVQNSGEADIQLSQSIFQKSNAFFQKKPRTYANLSSKPTRQENQFKYQDQLPVKSQTFKINQYESSKMEQISEESQRSDRLKFQSNRSKQTSKIKQSHASQYLEQQDKKQINYLQQENSIVYKAQQNQNFTFSHHGQSQIRLKKITKLTTITDPKAIRTCQFSQSGKYFALGTNSSFLKIFDVEQLYARKQPQKTIIPIYQIDNLHLKSIFCLNWSKNQKSIITCSNDLTIKITEFGQSMTNHRINVIGRHQSCIRMVKFNGLENKIISCGDDNLIKVWDISRIKKCTVLKGHEGSVSAFKLAENENQSIIYSVSKDSTIRKWDLRSGQCQLTSSYQESELTYIANHVDRIVVTHKNGTVSFFNNQLILDHSVQIHQQQIRSIDGLQEDGTLLTASFDGHVGIFNEKSILSPFYHLHNENQQDKVVFATFLQCPSINGYASTSTLGLCHLYSYQ